METDLEYQAKLDILKKLFKTEKDCRIIRSSKGINSILIPTIHGIKEIELRRVYISESFGTVMAGYNREENIFVMEMK